MKEFENDMINGIHASRYAASWLNALGTHRRNWMFKAWLKSLVINGRHLTEEEIYKIYCIGTNGKLELETDAEAFMNLPEEEQWKWDDM